MTKRPVRTSGFGPKADMLLVGAEVAFSPIPDVGGSLQLPERTLVWLLEILQEARYV